MKVLRPRVEELVAIDLEISFRVLYLVNVASPGVSQKINSPLVSGGNVFTGFAFSPDSSTVGYVSDQDTDEMLEKRRWKLTRESKQGRGAKR